MEVEIMTDGKPMGYITCPHCGETVDDNMHLKYGADDVRTWSNLVQVCGHKADCQWVQARGRIQYQKSTRKGEYCEACGDCLDYFGEDPCALSADRQHTRPKSDGVALEAVE
jgi:hypothetical protein